MKNIRDVVKNGLCLGCGVCCFEDGLGEMRFSGKKGQFVPELSRSGSEKAAEMFAICPGKGYSIIEGARVLYDFGTSYSIELGYVHKIYAVHSNKGIVLEQASSGGIITELCLHLLAEKIVDKVVVTKFIYTDEGVKTRNRLPRQL